MHTHTKHLIVLAGATLTPFSICLISFSCNQMETFQRRPLHGIGGKHNLDTIRNTIFLGDFFFIYVSFLLSPALSLSLSVSLSHSHRFVFPCQFHWVFEKQRKTNQLSLVRIDKQCESNSCYVTTEVGRPQLFAYQTQTEPAEFVITHFWWQIKRN